MSIADQKNVYITRNGTGYNLTIGEETRKITPGEALGLFTSLLHTLPEIPDGVRLGDHIRRGPRVTIRRHWSQYQNRIHQDRFSAMVHVAGTLVDQTSLLQTSEAALALASKRYGSELEVSEITDCPGSRKLATEKATEWIISDYLKRSGMTLLQLFSMIKRGEFPDGLDLEVKEVTNQEEPSNVQQAVQGEV